MDTQLGFITYAPPNSLGEAFVSPGGGGSIVSTVSTLYTLTSVGDAIFLNPNSGIVDTATMPTLAAVTSNTTGIVYDTVTDTTIINNNFEIPHNYNFSHNPENNTSFPTHTINANLQVGQPAILPGYNPDVQFYPTTFSVGDPIRVARSINLHSGALGTTITSVQGVSVDATIDVNLNAGGLIAIDSVGATTVNSGAGITMEAVGAVNLTAGGTITINGVGLTEIGGGDVSINAVNKQETVTGDTNLACSLFTAETGAMNLTTGILAVESAAFDLVSLAGFAFQGVGGVSFTTAGPYAFTGGDTVFNTDSFHTSNLIVSSINGVQYVPGGGGSGSNWSVYPATSDVNMSNYNLSNANFIIGNTAQFQTALAGTTYTTGLNVLTSATVASNLFISTVVAYKQISCPTYSGCNVTFLNGYISTLASDNFSVTDATIVNLNGFSLQSNYNNNYWSAFNALCNVNVNSNSIINCGDLQVSSINGAPYASGPLTSITAGNGIAVTGSAPSPTVSLNFTTGTAAGVYLTTFAGTQPLQAQLNPQVAYGTIVAPNAGGAAPGINNIGGNSIYTNGFGVINYYANPPSGGSGSLDLQTCIIYSDNTTATPYRPIVGATLTIQNNNPSGANNMRYYIYYEDVAGNFTQMGSIQLSPQTLARIVVTYHNGSTGFSLCPYSWLYDVTTNAGRFN